MTHSEYAQEVRSYLVEQHLDGRDDLALDAPLLEWGVLDSLTLTDFLAHIDQRFGIDVPMAEVTPENFASIDAVADLLSQLDSAGAAVPSP